ncbi:PASTA domain-containing protein [Tenacibaculum sp. 190524A02b]|uniref:PASTA domain-containing protein n=1 Tax=Tenacibaculum vairaonense TaxID=3137860 RepID=A0ABP1FBP7_9FLAO
MSNFSENIKGLLQFLKSKTFLKQLGIAIVSIFAFVFLLKWWLGLTTNHNQKIQVPDLQKMSLANVEQKLNELNLDYIVIDSASYNPNFPKKSVMEQNPEAGDFVKERRKIYLTLNPSKYRDVEIPDLNGRTRRQATTHLQSIGFKVGNDVTWVRDLGKDVVRGLKHKGAKIKPGTKLPKQTTINLILGDGNGN